MFTPKRSSASAVPPGQIDINQQIIAIVVAPFQSTLPSLMAFSFVSLAVLGSDVGSELEQE
jgi:hypothetical protein